MDNGKRGVPRPHTGLGFYEDYDSEDTTLFISFSFVVSSLVLVLFACATILCGE